MPTKKKDVKAAEFVTIDSFVSNFTKVLMGDLETKMRFTFCM